MAGGIQKEIKVTIFRRIGVVLLAGLLLASPLPLAAGVDEESIFCGARYPASELDLQLTDIQRLWWQRYGPSADTETKKKHPLITKAGMRIELDYYGDDRISATGWIWNLDGFLELSPQQRKQLVLDTLELVKSHLFMAAVLVDKKTGRMTGRILENRHIKLAVILNDVMLNDKMENIRLSFLPLDIGAGQAGYKDGCFVFSEMYFLNLEVHNGIAVSGDPNKFVIEKE